MNNKVASLITGLLSGMGVVLVLMLVQGRWWLPAQAEPIVLYVAPAGSCVGTEVSCYDTVQEAVDAATPGDEIRIATGVYTDVHMRPRMDITTTGFVTQVVYLTQSLTLHGGYTTTNWITPDLALNPTVLNAQDQGRVLYTAGDITVTLENLRLTHGNGNIPEFYGGGGIYGISATLILSGCQIDHNRESGLYLLNTNATLVANTIQENTAGFGSGGIALDSDIAPEQTNSKNPVLLIDNAILSNTSTYGDGGGLNLSTFSQAILIGNRIQGNASNGTDYKWMHGGGGLYLAGKALLEHNLIYSNTARLAGGGIYLGGNASTLNGNRIVENTGGGLYATLDTALLSNNLITGNVGNGLDLIRSAGILLNNVIAANQAGGLYIAGGTPQLLFNTLADNGGHAGIGIYASTYTAYGGRIYSSTIALTNTLLVSHSVGISVTAGNTLTINGVLWYATPLTVAQAASVTLFVQNEVYGDPAFATDGYHLTEASAAISGGVPTGLYPDIDQQPRRDPPDLGADEYWAPGALSQIYLPLILR